MVIKVESVDHAVKIDLTDSALKIFSGAHILFAHEIHARDYGPYRAGAERTRRCETDHQLSFFPPQRIGVSSGFDSVGF